MCWVIPSMALLPPDKALLFLVAPITRRQLDSIVLLALAALGRRDAHHLVVEWCKCRHGMGLDGQGSGRYRKYSSADRVVVGCRQCSGRIRRRLCKEYLCIRSKRLSMVTLRVCITSSFTPAWGAMITPSYLFSTPRLDYFVHFIVFPFYECMVFLVYFSAKLCPCRLARLPRCQNSQKTYQLPKHGC